jgi:peptidoglycan/LPS O-acetylase OafA/YrhL
MLAIHVWSMQTTRAIPSDSRWFFALFIGLVILTASITYRFIEMPGKRLLLSHVAFKSKQSRTTATDAPSQQ